MESHTPPRSGAPRRYKSKQQRPCDFCRRRRSACRIDSAPPCALCRGYGRECTFDEAPPPRRKQQPPLASPVNAHSHTGSDAGSISSMARTSPREHDGCGPQQDEMMQTLDTFPQGKGNYLEPAASLGMANGGVLDDVDLDYMALIDSFPYSQTALPVSQPPHPTPGLAPGLARVCARTIGQTDPLDPYILRQYRFDQNGDVPFKRLTVRSMSDGPVPVHFLISRTDAAVVGEYQDEGDRASAATNPQQNELNSLVPPDIGQRLLVLYSEYVMPQFPVVCLDPDENGPVMTPGVLAAIYIAASPFATFDDELCIQTVYDKPPIRQLKSLIWKSLHEHRDRPTLASLQSALLLALCPASDPLSPETVERTLLAGMIAAMANTLGLQHDPTDWNLPAHEKAVRRRLSCLVKANDTWTAMAAGRPPLISHDNWVLETVSAKDLSTNGLQETTLDTFVQYTQLTQILSCVLREVFTISALARLGTDITQTIQVTKPLMETLTNWYRCLPQDPRPPGQVTTINASGFLHLGYHATKALLFRGIMRPLHNAGYVQSPAGDQAENETARNQVRLGAMSCAAAFTAFIQELDAGDFQAFWPFWSTSAFAMQPMLWQILFLSSSTVEEARDTRQALVQARQLLRIRARSFEALRLGLLRVDSIWWRGLRDTIHLSPVVEQSLDEMGP